MEQIKTAGIVGKGAIGSALGYVLQKNNIAVKYFDNDSSRSDSPDIPTLAAASQIVFICAPSATNREIAHSIASTNPAPLTITVAKGVEPGFITMDQVLKDELKGSAYGLLYGPMIDEELKADKKGAAVLALAQSELKLNLGANLHLQVVSDTKSVALCGVLKNIYSVGLGINDGLTLGANHKGLLAVNMLKEMKAILNTLGADPAQAEGLAGLGDLLATGWSELSYNYRTGKALAEAPDKKPDGEGINSLKEISTVVNVSDYPILSTLSQIALEGKPAGLLENCLG